MRFFVVICLLCGCTIMGQTPCKHSLTGTVLDTHDSSVLAGATLIVVGSQVAVQSQLDGSFNVNNLCEGTYTIQVSHPACDTQLVTVTVPSVNPISINLEHHIDALQEVVVFSKKTDNLTETGQVLKLSQKTLERFSAQSLGDALETLSGVSTLKTGSTIVKPIIHGLFGSRITLIHNGTRIEDQQWGDEHAPTLSVNAVDRVTLVKGGAALRYSSDALGGTIITESKVRPFLDSLYGRTLLSLGSNGLGGNIVTRLTKTYTNGWFFEAGASAKRFGDFEAPNYILTNTGLREQHLVIGTGVERVNKGFSVNYLYTNNKIGILRASHVGSPSDLFRAIESDTPILINPFSYDIDVPRQEVAHHILKAKGHLAISKLGKLELQYDYQNNRRLEFDVRIGDRRLIPAVDLKLQTHTLAAHLESNFFKTVNFDFGGVFRHQNNFANPATGIKRLIPDYNRWEVALYSYAAYAPHAKLTLDAGVRADFISMDVKKFYGTSFWEARQYDRLFPELVLEDFGTQLLTNPTPQFLTIASTIGAKWKFKSAYNLKGNFSLTQRAPNVSELFSDGLHHGAARIEIGDLRFAKETSYKLTTALSKKYGKFTWSFAPYFSKIANYITLLPVDTRQTIRGAFMVWEYQQTDTQIWGLDVNAYWQFHRNWSTAHQISYVRGTDIRADIPLINIPATNWNQTLSYTSFEKNPWQVSLETQMVFRQTRFPVTPLNVFLPETNTVEILDVYTPPPGYTLINMAISKNFNTTKTPFEIGIQAINILNTTYRNYLNRQRFFSDDLGRNIQLNFKINY